MSLPNCHCQIVVAKPNCHYQIVITKLSLPNCHYQIDITKNPPVKILRVAPVFKIVKFNICMYIQNTLKENVLAFYS